MQRDGRRRRVGNERIETERSANRIPKLHVIENKVVGMKTNSRSISYTGYTATRSDPFNKNPKPLKRSIRLTSWE